MSQPNKKSQKTDKRSVITPQSKAEEKPTKRQTAPAFLAKVLLDTLEVQPKLFGVSINISKLVKESLKGRGAEYRKSLQEKRKSLEERKIGIVKQLLESDIDPNLFDVLLQNELDRRLKVRFGFAFLVLTVLFTAASYAIVICDGVYNWDISETAITALVIETPMQFIGLLYIIARNLFPHTDRKHDEKTKRRPD